MSQGPSANRAMEITVRYWCGRLFLVVFVGSFFMTALHFIDNFRLAQSDRTISAFIQGTHDRNFRLGGHSWPKQYFVYYQYDVDGETFRQERNVPLEVYEAHNTGNTVEIRLHPTRDHLFEAYPGDRRDTPWRLISLTLLSGILGAYMTFSRLTIADRFGPKR